LKISRPNLVKLLKQAESEYPGLPKQMPSRDPRTVILQFANELKTISPSAAKTLIRYSVARFPTDALDQRDRGQLWLLAGESMKKLVKTGVIPLNQMDRFNQILQGGEFYVGPYALKASFQFDDPKKPVERTSTMVTDANTLTWICRHSNVEGYIAPPLPQPDGDTFHAEIAVCAQRTNPYLVLVKKIPVYN